MSTLKKPKTSKTKVSDDLLNAGSGKTIKQPNVNDDKLTTITEMRQQAAVRPAWPSKTSSACAAPSWTRTGTKSKSPIAGRFSR